MFKYSLGLSPFYHASAPGHFGKVLPSISQALAIEAGLTASKSEYLGLRDSQSIDSKAHGVSEEFQSLNAIARWKEIRELAKEISLKVENRQALLHIYEGTFSLIFIAVIAGRRSKNLVTIFNFHNVEFYTKFLDSRIRKVFFGYFLRYIKILNSKIIYATESKMAADIFERELQIRFEVFPMFSTVQVDLNETEMHKEKSRSQSLVLIGGNIHLNTLLKDLQSISQDPSRVTIFDIRLSYPEYSRVANVLAASGYKVLKNELNGKDYVSLFRSSKTVWFLTKSKINLLGSSGRLTDAIICGCDVVVPENSALEDMVKLYKKKYQIFSYTGGSITELREVSSNLESSLASLDELTPRGAAKQIISIYARNLESLQQNSFKDSFLFPTIYPAIFLAKTFSKVLRNRSLLDISKPMR